MDAIVVTQDEDQRSLGVQSVPIPNPGYGDVRLNVIAAGVCGSDVGAWLGKDAYDFLEFPRILGHEYVGVIDAVGPGVERFSVGDRVVERPLHSCGTCQSCLHGSNHVCENVEITGFHSDGAFAPDRVVSTDSLHPVPDGFSDQLAAVTEPMAVSARAVLRRSSLEPGDDVLVLGAGPMGAFSALIADHSNANVVVGGLPSDEVRFGMLDRVETVNLEATPLEELAAETVHDGFDIVIDATGSSAALEDGLEVLRRGGEAVVIGIPHGTIGVPVPSFVRGEKTVKGSYGATIGDFERAIRVIDGLAPRITRTITQYDPNDATTAFNDFKNGRVIKPVFDVSLLNTAG